MILSPLLALAVLGLLGFALVYGGNRPTYQEFTIYWLFGMGTFLAFCDPTFVGTLLFWKCFIPFGFCIFLFVLLIFWLQKLDNRMRM